MCLSCQPIWKAFSITKLQGCGGEEHENVMKLSRGPLRQVDSCNRISALADRGRMRVGFSQTGKSAVSTALREGVSHRACFLGNLPPLIARVIMLATKSSYMCVSWPAADILGAASKIPRFDTHSKLISVGLSE